MDESIPSITFLCGSCQIRFLSESELKKHIKMLHKIRQIKKKVFKCPKCGRVINSLNNYNQHVKSHSGNDGTTCPYCNRQFKALKDHIRNVHREKKFVCWFECCEKSFSKKHGLERHLKTHSDDFKPYQCPNCSRVFVEKIQLERHFQVHLKPEKITDHRCASCLKFFNRKYDLERHNKTVHQNKSYECDLCPSRRFGTKFEVLRHFRIVHWGEKPKRKKTIKVPIKEIISCSIVKPTEEESSNKTFEFVEGTQMKVTLESVELLTRMNEDQDTAECVIEELDEEILIAEFWAEPLKLTTQRDASNLVQWECQRCSRTYESSQRLKLHNIRNHNWKCKLCPTEANTVESFHRKEDFILHWFEHHLQQSFPDKIECSICLDLFASISALHKHQSKEHGIEVTKHE